MTLYWADDFLADLIGDPPAGWADEPGSVDTYVVTTTSPNGGKSCQVSAGGFVKSPAIGPELSSMTIYITFYGAGPGVILTLANLSVAPASKNCLFLQIEPDYTVSLIGGDNEFLGNSFAAPPCSPNNWNSIRLDLYLAPTPTTPAWLGVSGVLYINSVLAAYVGGTVFIAIPSGMPTGTASVNNFAFSGTHSPYFTNLALCSAWTTGDLNPFAAAAASPPTIIDARVSNITAEYLCSPTPAAYLSQFLLEVMIVQAPTGGNYAAQGSYAGVGQNSAA